MKKGVLVSGATGTVGRQFISQLQKHPEFKVVAVAASRRSAGKTYAEAVKGRWDIKGGIPLKVRNLKVYEVSDIGHFAGNVCLIFSALDMPKEKIRVLEEMYAQAGIPVVSNNSAHRWTKDVPMIIPEVNPGHISLIRAQRKYRGWKKGLIAVKPNCSLQSFLIAVYALRQFKPRKIMVVTEQAISGAGETFETFPGILDNVIPFIEGEEEKTQEEPLKILGRIENGKIELKRNLVISAQCNRVATSDGHMARVSIKFAKNPTKEQILEAWETFTALPQKLDLPSAPKPPLIYLEALDRPQTRLDRDTGDGMAITLGQLRPCNVLDWKLACLSHNTKRGAAGGAILIAELLKAKGYIL